MARLLIHVEGETEETFVNELLGRHLLACGYESVGACLLGNARHRSRRGGIRPWIAVRRDIIRHLREDQRCISTTMVDFYGLPRSGERAWPGRAEAATVGVADADRGADLRFIQSYLGHREVRHTTRYVQLSPRFEG